ncbi:MAG: hypothetical protein H8E40_12650 [Chloroflexi bacterium]|nr:hypothetical protein [Chloroflexota bacterium]
MSFDSLLTDLFTSQRRTLTGTDAYGGPIYSWADHLTDQPCLLQANRGAVEEVADIHGEKVISTHRLYCRICDIVEGDRITVSGGEGGPDYDALTRTYDILSIEQAAGQHHHIQMALKAIESTQE